MYIYTYTYTHIHTYIYIYYELNVCIIPPHPLTHMVESWSAKCDTLATH
jgi:hypothetical protein